MIKKTSSNIEKVKQYLMSLSEDELIEKITIPFFNSYGYSTYLVNTHGPGERGRDVIFRRFSGVLSDFEYIAVQTKAEKINTNNISDYVNQLVRAIKNPIENANGAKANYSILFCSKEISNDARQEFPALTDNNQNIKIICVDSLPSLLLDNSDAIPDELRNNLTEGNAENFDDINQLVTKVLYKNDPNEVNHFFKDVISISKRNLSEESKEMIIDYIFKTWREDSSWNGTVRPMHWLSDNYDLIADSQLPYLKDVLVECSTSTPSFAASQYTDKVFSQITDDQIFKIKNSYLEIMLRDVNSLYENNKIIQRYIDWVNRYNDVSDSDIELKDKILRIRQLMNGRHERTDSEQEEVESIINYFYSLNHRE